MSTLNVLVWNAQTGNGQAVSSLTSLVKTHRPDVVVLIEAGYLADDLETLSERLGFSLFQESPLRYRPGFGVVPEQGDTAVLVDAGVKVKKFHVAAMTQPWTGPKHNWLHAPRRYWRLRLQVGGRTWRLSAEHWPTGNAGNAKAVAETEDRARKWLRRGLLASSVLLGDLNQSTRALASQFGSVVGNGPDNAIFRRCGASRVVLDNYGSDHKAVLFTFRR